MAKGTATKAASKRVKQAVVAAKDKRGDFVRLAEGRAAAAVKAIQLIGNLSNTADYEFTQGDVETVMGAIRQEMAATESRFKAAMQKVARKPVRLSA